MGPDAAGALEITLVAHDIGPVGGMERQISALLEGLLGRGHSVIVVSRTCEVSAHSRLRWIRVRGPARPFPIAYLWFFFSASLAVRKHRRGILHTTGAIVPSRATVSTVHFCHRAFSEKTALKRAAKAKPYYRVNAWAAERLSRLGERLLYRPSRTHRLVAVSEGVAAELREYFPAMRDSVTVIPNGVDTDLFRPGEGRRTSLRSSLGIPSEGLLALFVGGEWERKGLRIAIEAVARAPCWRLAIVGEGDIGRFRELAATTGVADRTHFVGRTSDIAPYYQAADAFVLPTAYETFSLVALEAAATGLPLLVTRVSGVEERLEEGVSGWFIERDPEDIARRLRELEANDDLRRSMGAAAREHAAGYGWERVVDAYATTYRELSNE